MATMKIWCLTEIYIFFAFTVSREFFKCLLGKDLVQNMVVASVTKYFF
jgi:hypothetical protein